MVELRKTKEMKIFKVVLPLLAAISLTGCWDKFSKTEEQQPQAQPQAARQNQKNPVAQLQSMLVSREGIGLNLEYVVRVSGPAMRITGNQQQFDLQGCKFLLTTDDAKQSILGVQLELSSECPVDVGPIINADRRIKPSELTFGMAEQYFRPGNYLSDCLSMCGNAYAPSIFWAAEGSRADGFETVVLSVPIAEDAMVNAAGRWRDAMEKSESEDWIATQMGFNCAPQKYRDVAVREFSRMRPAYLSFGYSVEYPTCTEPALIDTPVAVNNGLVTVPKPRSDCDMEYGVFLKSKGLVPKEKSIHGPDDKDFIGYGCPYRIEPSPGTTTRQGSKVTFRSAWESS